MEETLWEDTVGNYCTRVVELGRGGRGRSRHGGTGGREGESGSTYALVQLVGMGCRRKSKAHAHPRACSSAYAQTCTRTHIHSLARIRPHTCINA